MRTGRSEAAVRWSVGPLAEAASWTMGPFVCHAQAGDVTGALAGVRLPAWPCPENADVNGDGAINSLDATFILQFDAGFIDRLPP